MRIAVVSDEPYPVNQAVVRELERRGHAVVRFGSVASGQPESWVAAGRAAAMAVGRGDCHEGIFFCWTGTGIAMVANKTAGVRAALCIDPETAVGARIWNHANVLVLSNRLITDERAREIVDAWFGAPINDPRGTDAVAALCALEEAAVR